MVNLALGLPKSRWNVHVVNLGGEEPLADVLRSHGVAVQCLGVSKRRPIRAIRQLAAVLRRIKPQLLQCFMFHANVAGRLGGWVTGVPWILGGLRVAEHQKAWHLTLDRLTAATGPVRARTAADLGAIGLTDAEDGIPTLAEVLDIVAGRAPLLIELKDQSGQMGPDMAGLPEATAAVLKGYAGPVAVMSFNPHAMAEMARHAPDIPRGLTTYDWPADEMPDRPGVAERRVHLAAIADYDAVGACFISHHWRDLSRPRVAELKAQGAAVLCWTIRSPEQESEARRVAQNITFEGYQAGFPAG
jgi:glycerophosphoryl diester phosphodiesterase